jgi:hypothetical protein
MSVQYCSQVRNCHRQFALPLPVSSNTWKRGAINETRAPKVQLWIESLSRPPIAFWGVRTPRSVVQNYIEQRFANPNAAVVLNKAKLAEAVHEEADTGSSGADHSRKSVLRDLWN